MRQEAWKPPILVKGPLPHAGAKSRRPRQQGRGEDSQGTWRRGVLSVRCAQGLLVSMCCLCITPLRWSKARHMVHPLQAPSSLAHSTHSLGTGQAPSTAQHSTANTMWPLPSRIGQRRRMSQVPSRRKYGLRLRYKPASGVRVDPYGSISAHPICAGKGFSERVH